MYIIFLILKNTINGTIESCTYLKVIIGYLQLKLSTNLVWNYCSIQFVLPWNVQFFWIKTALGESENKSIARIKNHTWKHSLKCTFCCHSTFSECLQLKWVQSCGSTSLIDNFIISNLTLCAVLNRWNPRVARTLQHRRRSILMFWNFNWRLSLGKVWYHKSSHVVEARGSLEKLSAKAHAWRQT